MKRRVLIAASAVMMALVVYVWIGYFNSIVMGNPVQLANQGAVAQSGTAAPAVATQPSAPGFWTELGSGFVSMYHGMVSGFQGAGNALQAPKQYEITPATQPSATQ